MTEDQAAKIRAYTEAHAPTILAALISAGLLVFGEEARLIDYAVDLAEMIQQETVRRHAKNRQMIPLADRDENRRIPG